jgi:hypothetical protein
MKVRIRQHEEFPNTWYVETAHWWWTGWVQRTHISGEDAQKRALAVAVALRKPNIIEVL